MQKNLQSLLKPNLMAIDQVSKGEEDTDEGKENGSDSGVYNPQEEVELEGWESLLEIHKTRVHCSLSISLCLHNKHVLQVEDHERL